jgi:DNA primase
MKIPSHFVQELKHSLNIVDVAAGFMKLVKKGRNYFALCPFHTEKTPSFSINEQLQTYHCFGCGKGGDVIQLVMELENLTYVEAIHSLADAARLRVPVADGIDEKQAQEKKFLYTVLEEAAKFYRRSLESPEGADARAYLDRRKISRETRDLFQMGHAPGNGFHLINYLRGLGVQDRAIQQAGLAKVSERSGNLYDTFRNRLMIPITDFHGRVIAFGGRILGEGEPKYLNSPETPVYQKGFHLFGLAHTLKEIRSADRAILVEGYFDMIVPFQAGFHTMAASLGTSLTTAQIKLLGRFTRNVVICFDPDAAGANAAFRSVELFLENDFDCRVAVLPAGYDPDTYVLEKGAEAYQAAIDGALPFLDYLLRQKLREVVGELTIERKVKILEGLFPYIARIPHESVRSKYFSDMAQTLGIDKDALLRQFNAFAKSRKISTKAVGEYSRTPVPEGETILVNFIFHFPELVPRVFSDLQLTFDGFATSNILGAVQEAVAAGEALDLEGLESRFTEHDRILLHQILSKDAKVITEAEARNTVLALKSKELEKEKKRLDEELERAVAAGQTERVRELQEARKRVQQQKIQPKIQPS